MKNLFATASYTFNNFYNNLNTSGQMIFSVIILLIVILCILLLITYIVQEFQAKLRLKKLKEEVKSDVKHPHVELKKEDVTPLNTTEKTEIEDIASAISDALQENDPITLTDFEEDQEKTAIISIDELMKRAKELQLIEDEENEGVNYLEKYNLGPAEVGSMNLPNEVKEEKKEVKAFKVSQVISPIYGVKKEVINGENK